jgi:hypothetical protein
MSGEEPEKPNPYQSPVDSSAPAEPDQRSADPIAVSRKHLTLLGMLVLSGIGGLCSGLVPEDPSTLRAIHFVEAILLAGLIVQWCHYDSRERGLPRWRFLPLLMVFCPGPLFMVPVYLFSTRGARGFLSVILAIALSALLVAVNIFAALLGLVLAGVPLF